MMTGKQSSTGLSGPRHQVPDALKSSARRGRAHAAGHDSGDDNTWAATSLDAPRHLPPPPAQFAVRNHRFLHCMLATLDGSFNGGSHAPGLWRSESNPDDSSPPRCAAHRLYKVCTTRDRPSAWGSAANLSLVSRLGLHRSAASSGGVFVGRNRYSVADGSLLHINKSLLDRQGTPRTPSAILFQLGRFRVVTMSSHHANMNNAAKPGSGVAGQRRSGRGAERPPRTAVLVPLWWRVVSGVRDAMQFHQLWPMLRQSR
jgi:hypothetical protein